MKDGKKFQHDGIRLELVGSIGEYDGVCQMWPRQLAYDFRLFCYAIRDVTEMYYDR